MKSIKPCLMFVGNQHGKAEEAINFYTSIFTDSEILHIERVGQSEENEQVGNPVKSAIFTVNGVEHMAMDSGLNHNFTFTPAISLFVEFDSSEEFHSTYEKLMEFGHALMPIDYYGFSDLFAWVQDRFGVTWQLNLTSA